MCTIIPKEQWGNPKIAEEDFEVFKECKGILHSTISVHARFKLFTYHVNKLNTVHMCVTENTTAFDTIEARYRNSLINPICIGQGFHSLLECEDAKQRVKDGSALYCFCKFIVPKGALYYTNEVGNCVSNQIIFKEILHAPEVDTED